MPLRDFRLPYDIQTMIDILPLAFQYPENPEWSLDAEEIRGAIEQIQRIQRLWPLFRMLLMVSPSLRDELNGVVWEEAGQAFGLANVGRQGMTNSWSIANVGVLPAYRRRGIARKLVEGTIDLARKHSADQVVLQVIDGNTPAFDLYRSLGFVLYDTGIELTTHQTTTPPHIPLPGGYVINAIPMRNWRPRYELARRITPAEVQRFEPITEARFRTTWIQLLLPKLFGSGEQTRRIAAYDAAGTTVAFARYSCRLRPGGVNAVSILLDPAHAALAPHLVSSLVTDIITSSPGRKIDFQVRGWNQALIDAALAIGFSKRMAGNSMGLCL